MDGSDPRCAPCTGGSTGSRRDSRPSAHPRHLPRGARSPEVPLGKQNAFQLQGAEGGSSQKSAGISIFKENPELNASHLLCIFLELQQPKMQIFSPYSPVTAVTPAPSTKPLTPNTHIGITSHPRPPCTRTSLVPISSPEAPQSPLWSTGTPWRAHNTAQSPSPCSSQPAHTTHRNQSVPSVPPQHPGTSLLSPSHGLLEKSKPQAPNLALEMQGRDGHRVGMDGHRIGTATLCPVLESQKSGGRGMAPSA